MFFSFLSPSKSLPEKETLKQLVEKATEVLSSEKTDYRPASSSNEAGGLLQFDDNLPTILVPDLHARDYFLSKLFNYQLFDGKTVETLMSEGKLRVICLGDGLHSEKRGKERWIKAYEEFVKGKLFNKYMKAEMAEGLNLMALVMEAKCKYPKYFHFIKGNHENILNETSNGNHAFYKFSAEGEMTKDFMLGYYGVELTEKYSQFECSLPLFIIDNNFLASHAEPVESYSKERLINGMNDGELIFSLTWTRNGDVEDTPAVDMLNKFLPDKPNAYYFAGHRPVPGVYELREDGRFVQFHNPERMNVAFIQPGKDFDLEKDFISLD